MLNSTLEQLKVEASRCARLTGVTHYVLSNGKIVSAEGFLIDSSGGICIEFITFPPQARE